MTAGTTRKRKSPGGQARARKEKARVTPVYPAGPSGVNARLCLTCGYFRQASERRRRTFCMFTGETAEKSGCCEFWNESGGDAA